MESVYTYSPLVHQAAPYRGYKDLFSVVLMAVCRCEISICSCECGEPGQAFRLFAHSGLHRAMDGDLPNVPTAEPLPNSNTGMPYTFVGGDTFLLQLDLQRPCSHRELDHDQRVYNYYLPRAQRVVENAFGIWAQGVQNHNLPG